MRPIALLLLCTLAAACGTSTENFTINGEDVTRTEFEERTGGSDGSTTNEALVQDLTALETRLAASGLTSQSNSSFETVNAMEGTADFTGILDIATRGVPGLEINATSQVNLTANFDTNAISATVGDFVVRNIDGENLGTPTSTVSLSDGEIGGNRANAVSFRLAGTLEDAGPTVFVNGFLDGSFVGTPVTGLVARETSAFAIVNGASARNTTISLQALAN